MVKNLSQVRPTPATGKTGAGISGSSDPHHDDDAMVHTSNPSQVGSDQQDRNSDKAVTGGSTQPRVMIIDDSKTIRRSAQSLLSKEGWDVVTAEDGFDALAKVVENRPDIVFVDIMMPRLDGYQTCALIKNNAAFNSTPVIMLSSKDSIFDKARGRIVGSEHYLTKPFTREDLLGTIERHLPDGVSPRSSGVSKEGLE